MPRPLPDDLAWRLLQSTLLIRRFEEAVLQLSLDGKFRGHYHLYVGQEATGAAVMSALAPRDKLNTTHRNHGHVLVYDVDPGLAPQTRAKVFDWVAKERLPVAGAHLPSPGFAAIERRGDGYGYRPLG